MRIMCGMGIEGWSVVTGQHTSGYLECFVKERSENVRVVGWIKWDEFCQLPYSHLTACSATHSQCCCCFNLEIVQFVLWNRADVVLCTVELGGEED